MPEGYVQPTPADRGVKTPMDTVSECLALLGDARSLCERLDASLYPFGVTLREYELLRCLSGRSLSQSAIVRELNTNKVSVSRGVRRLCARGWVNSSLSFVDKRVTMVMLTDTGAAQLAQLEAHVAEFLTVLYAGLDKRERQLLSHINRSLRQFLRPVTD